MSKTPSRLVSRALAALGLALALSVTTGRDAKAEEEAIDFSCAYTCITEFGLIEVEDGLVFTFRDCTTTYTGTTKITTCIYVR